MARRSSHELIFNVIDWADAHAKDLQKERSSGNASLPDATVEHFLLARVILTLEAIDTRLKKIEERADG